MLCMKVYLVGPLRWFVFGSWRLEKSPVLCQWTKPSWRKASSCNKMGHFKLNVYEIILWYKWYTVVLCCFAIRIWRPASDRLNFVWKEQRGPSLGRIIVELDLFSFGKKFWTKLWTLDVPFAKGTRLLHNTGRQSSGFCHWSYWVHPVARRLCSGGRSQWVLMWPWDSRREQSFDWNFVTQAIFYLQTTCYSPCWVFCTYEGCFFDSAKIKAATTIYLWNKAPKAPNKVLGRLPCRWPWVSGSPEFWLVGASRCGREMKTYCLDDQHLSTSIKPTSMDCFSWEVTRPNSWHVSFSTSFGPGHLTPNWPNGCLTERQGPHKRAHGDALTCFSA